MLDPRLGRIAADLAGVDGVRLWQDQALIKEPYGEYTAFHVDNTSRSMASPQDIKMWVALDDATLANGCLYYLPGTHEARRHDDIGVTPVLGALFEVYPDWKDITPVPCPVPAGGALFHNTFTAHGAGANMTPGRRRAITCNYMPDGTTFNGELSILPPQYLARLGVGDRLDDDDYVPLIFGRHRSSPRIAPTGSHTP
jgi:ectoine hydroxylase-related dioxygenase (phytanoyl-CoA dioxygenase family)